MASGSSQARMMEQFVCGTPGLETWWQAHSLDTRIGSRLWDSRQMASGSSQALPIEQFVCGTPGLETWWGAHSLDTRIRSDLWDSRQMASRSSQARSIEQFVCGTPRWETRSQAHLLDKPIRSPTWDSCQMTSASSGDKSIHMMDDTRESLITIIQVNFTDQSVINSDGWICGNKRELLMWIPPMHRAHLHRPRNIWVAGEYETRLDLSNFVHGCSWMSCIDS